MGYIRTEQEVDKMIDEMVRKTKGKYITQGVSFNKESARQMELLKMVLMRATSFSGFIKELLAQEETDNEVDMARRTNIRGGYAQSINTPTDAEVEKPINTGNFL